MFFSETTDVSSLLISRNIQPTAAILSRSHLLDTGNSRSFGGSVKVHFEERKKGGVFRDVWVAHHLKKTLM